MTQFVALKRSLTMSHIVTMGLAWMSPMIFFTSIGVLYEGSGGRLFAAYLIAFIAIFFTALSYGQMAKAFPKSGSAYTYVSKSFNPVLGFIVGWAVLLDYIFACIVSVLMFGINLNAQFHSIPIFVWVTLVTLIVMIVNIVGIKFSANMNKIFVILQIVFIAGFCALLIYRAVNNGMTFGLNPLSNPHSVPFSMIMGGASLVVFSFLGFDSVTTLAEETKSPKNIIPRSIMWIIGIAGLLYFTTAYLIQQMYPELAFTNPDSAGFELMRIIAGPGLSSIFTFVIIFAVFSQAMSSLTTVTRLLYVMGQSSLLPKLTFGSVHPKFNTPTFNIVLMSLVSLAALFISLENAIRFLNFGALSAFFFVNLSVPVHYVVREKRRSPKDLFIRLLCPSVGAMFILYLFSLLDSLSFWLGGTWLFIGIVIYLFRKRRLQWIVNPIPLVPTVFDNK